MDWNAASYTVESENYYAKNGEDVTEKTIGNDRMRITSWFYRSENGCALDVDVFEYAGEGYVLSARKESFFDYGCNRTTDFSWNPRYPDSDKQEAYLKWLKFLKIDAAGNK